MSGQQILTGVGAVVGAVIGYYAGGNVAYGAELGAAAGAAIGGIAFQNRPRTAKINVQTNGYGDVLGKCWGNARMNGKAIWAAPISAVSAGGKGSSPTGNVQNFYGTFAVALCEGPIQGIRRIWFNGILVYDISSTATSTTLVNSNQFANNHMRVYLGDLVQKPDPTMESILGVGNVPAYRGTAYLVFGTVPLLDYANVLPSVSAEVVTLGVTTNITQVWRNNSTGFPFDATGIALRPFASGFVSGTIRFGDRNGTTGISDGFIYRLDLGTGAVLSTDAPNGYENSLHMGGSGAYASEGLVMAQQQQSAGVYGTNPPSTIVGQQSTPGSAELYGRIYISGAVNGDVLAALTPAPSGTWTLCAHFPGADGTHLAVVTSDGSANAWLHVVAIDKYGVPGEVARYPFASYSDMSTYVNSTRTWWPSVGFGGGSPPGGMLESDLIHFWILNSSSTVSRWQVSTGTVSIIQAISAGSPTGGGTLWADAGVCVYASGTVAVCWTDQLGARTQIALSSIVTDIAESAGLTSGQINATALTDSVWGFLADRELTARALFEALIPAWWFDAVESDQVLKFVHRSGTSLATITLDDMGADTNAKNNASPLSFVRGSEIELPSQVNVTYYAVGADFQPGIQYARRLIGLESNNVQVIDTAAVMDDTQAAVAAAIIMWDTIAGRIVFKFSTSYKWAQYEPTDVLTIQTGNESYLARCTRKTEGGGKIDWEFTACAPVYSQAANGGAITSGQGVNGSSPTTAVLMDIPPLRDSDGVGGPYLYVAMYNPGLSTAFSSWPGATLFKSGDGGSTFVAGITMGTEATVGQATTALPNFSGGNIFDELSTVTVNVTTGQGLTSTTNSGVLSGANVALLGNEILQFRTATLLSGTSYLLSGFLRGRFATEYAMSGHGVGELFVLLAPPGTVGLQPTVAGDIGAARIWDCVSLGQPLGTGLEQTITEAGNTLVCFDPVYLFATLLTGDIKILWIRRNRITWQWMESVEEPMSEATEAYVVSIFNGASVVRTISVSGTGVENATYTSAQQTTDFGTPFTSGSSITFGVQQISAITGPGRMAKATVVLVGSTPLAPPLDALSVSANAAYGLRLMRTAYSGHCVKVRRSSDNTTQDIGFVGNALDTASLATFVGGSSGYIDTWYDQSGHGYNATQTTQANQPQIVNAGTLRTLGGQPSAFFISASSTQLSVPVAAGVSGTVDSTINLVIDQTTSMAGTTIPLALGDTVGTGSAGRVAASFATTMTGGFSTYGGGNSAITSITIYNTPTVMTGTWAGTNTITAYMQGTSSAVNSSGYLTASTAAAIGQGASLFFDGLIPEIVLISSAISTADRHLLERNQGAFFGITVA